MIFWYSHSDIFHLSVISALQHLSTYGHTGWPLILILIRTRKTWAVKLGGSENSATLQICDSQQSQTLTFVAVSPHKQAHQHCHQLMRKLFVKGRCYWMKFFTLNACSIKEWEVHHAHITHTHTHTHTHTGKTEETHGSKLSSLSFKTEWWDMQTFNRSARSCDVVSTPHNLIGWCVCGHMRKDTRLVLFCHVIFTFCVKVLVTKTAVPKKELDVQTSSIKKAPMWHTSWI